MKTFLLKYLFFLIPLLLVKAQTPKWNIIGQMPHPVAEGNAVVFDNNIYILGGYLDSLQASTDWIQSYNPKTNKWKIVTKMNAPRSNFAAGVNSQGVYYAGGADDLFQIENKNEYLEFWNFDSTQFPTVLYSSPSFDKYFVNGIVDESDIFLIGGISYSVLDFIPTLISKHSIVQNVTTETIDFFIADSSDFLYGHMSVKLGSRIFVIGGFLKGVSQNILAFRNGLLYEDTFQASLLTPRAGGQAVAIPQKNEIFIIAGQNELSAALNSVEIFRITGNDITNVKAPSINKARSDFMSVLFENKIYIFGGYDEHKNIVSEIEVLDVITDVNKVKLNTFNSFKLEQNYPNPFNPITKISYSIPEVNGNFISNINVGTEYFQSVNLAVYNVLGKEVTTLVDERKYPGQYTVEFSGDALPSGVYFYKLSVGTFSETKSMLLLK